MGITQGDLHKLPKGSAQKVAIAAVVKQRTVVTNAWIAAQLHMGAASRVSAYCGVHSLQGEIKDLVNKINISI